MLINHKENNKLRIRNADKSFTKHELVKLLIMIMSRRKHKDAGIYSEWTIDNGDIIDVFVEYKNNKIYYEVQKEVSKQWTAQIIDRDYKEGICTTIIPLKTLSDNIEELEKQLEDYVV